MLFVDPILTAVSAHRAAWEAFQVAPGGDDSDESMNACCAMADALDALMVSACSFPILTRPLPAGARALLDHLRWWLAEEVDFADGYQPNYGILQGRAADLAAVLEPPPTEDSDPVMVAVVAADMAALTHSAALVFRDEADDASEDLVDAMAVARDAAFQAVQRAMPSTLSGLLTLVRYYGRDCRIYDACGSGAGYFEHVAAAVAALIAREARPGPAFKWQTMPVDPTARATRSGVPGQPEIEAAWLALPPAERDRISFIAVDMAAQSFIAGHSYSGADRPVPRRSKAHQVIRAAADDACHARLTELHRVIEDALPDLFGPTGENPEWAVQMGARR